MKDIKISVIMPVYKVEDFVERTIESVLNQSLAEIEFFAIDDGSPDRSGEICDKYAEQDSRMIVIHKKNGGAPEARNVAIEKATGKYLYFIDSDDWIETTMLEKMYNLAEKNDADLVVTGFCMEYYEKNKYVTYKNQIEDKIYTTQQDFRNDAYQYLNNSILSLPWNKLYLNKIVKEEGIRFPNTKWDDHHFNMDYIKKIKKVVMSSMTEYHWYRSRKGSETMINYNDPKMFNKRKEHYMHIKEVYKYWNMESDKISRDAISSYYVGRLFQCIQELTDNSNFKYMEKRKKIYEILNDSETVYSLKYAKSLSVKFKILTIPMKIKNVTLCYIFGKIISIIRRCFPSIFIKLKEREVHSKK